MTINELNHILDERNKGLTHSRDVVQTLNGGQEHLSTLGQQMHDFGQSFEQNQTHTQIDALIHTIGDLLDGCEHAISSAAESVHELEVSLHAKFSALDSAETQLHDQIEIAIKSSLDLGHTLTDFAGQRIHEFEQTFQSLQHDIVQKIHSLSATASAFSTACEKSLASLQWDLDHELTPLLSQETQRLHAEAVRLVSELHGLTTSASSLAQATFQELISDFHQLAAHLSQLGKELIHQLAQDDHVFEQQLQQSAEKLVRDAAEQIMAEISANEALVQLGAETTEAISVALPYIIAVKAVADAIIAMRNML